MALEFDEQLSRLEKPSRDEMTNKEYAVFNENVETMEKNWGFINNSLGSAPERLPVHRLFELQGLFVQPGDLLPDNADKEMIGVVVSSINCCSYCLTTHGDALRGYTKNPMLVDKLSYNFRSAKDMLTEKQYALCEYAWYVTKHADEIGEEQVENLRKVGFNDHEILEAAFVAGFFNYTNRWVSTILPGGKSRPFQPQPQLRRLRTG